MHNTSEPEPGPAVLDVPSSPVRSKMNDHDRFMYADRENIETYLEYERIEDRRAREFNPMEAAFVRDYRNMWGVCQALEVEPQDVACLFSDETPMVSENGTFTIKLAPNSSGWHGIQGRGI